MSNLDKHKTQLLELHKRFVMNTRPKVRESEEFIQLYAQLYVLVGAFWFNENILEMENAVNARTCLEIISEEELSQIQSRIEKFISSN